MIIERSNYLKITYETNQEKEVIENIIKRYCIHKNPKKEENNNKKYFFNTPSILKTYNVKKNTFYVYRGNKDVYDSLISTSLRKKIIDNRNENYVDIECHVNPRDEEQEKALRAFLENDFGYGILSATPSTGKTFISLKLASFFKQRTLIIVDMTLLIDQFIDSILNFTNIKEEEICIIRGSNLDFNDNHKVIISTVQTLSKQKELSEKLSRKIGYLIVDEVHVASCNTFQELLPLFNPKYQIGLSGTPFRDDEMEFLIMESVGPIIYTADRKKMLEAGSMLLPILRPIFIKDDKNFYKNNDGYEIKFRDVVEEYYLDKRTINKITNLVLHHYNNNDSQLLICKENNMVDLYYFTLMNKLYGFNILEKAEEEKRNNISKLESELNEKLIEIQKMKHISKGRKKQLEYSCDIKEYKKDKKNKLKEKYEKLIKKENDKKWYESDCIRNNENFNKIKIINGSLKREAREQIIKDTNNGITKIVITTTAMDKAVSINKLNIVYLLFSTRERANTVQRIGRVIRAFPGKKTAIVYDIIYDHYMSFYQFYNNKGNCRFNVLKDYSQYYESIFEFIKYLENRFKKNKVNYKEIEKFEREYKSKYIIEI